ncbi:hypothetical protein BN1708_002226 [Verticillium longisporum]|uniref:Secreted protein n=1 Tax=Verticillium longisporum TaxID=100787 RepID=A0A0G4KMD4_VERLO|nr:hypothetical protein BN1708_002226 [Verticillium longisporum]
MIASLAPTRRSRLLMTRAFFWVVVSQATPPIVPSHSPARPLVTAPLRAGKSVGEAPSAPGPVPRTCRKGGVVEVWWAPGAGAGLQSYDGWDGNMMTGDTREDSPSCPRELREPMGHKLVRERRKRAPGTGCWDDVESVWHVTGPSSELKC